MPKYYKTAELKSELSDIRILYYEILMLNKIPITSTDDFVENNMRIESFLLHARNITEFLKGGGHLKCSGFQNCNGKKISPVKVISKDVIEKINEYLSHISTRRKTRKITWDLHSLRKKVNQEFNHFLNKISPKYFPSKERLNISDFDNLIKN